MRTKSFLDQKIDLITDKYIEAKKIYQLYFMIYWSRGDIIEALEMSRKICDINIDYELLINILSYTNDNFE
jgi:hypothetical protein